MVVHRVSALFPFNVYYIQIRSRQKNTMAQILTTSNRYPIHGRSVSPYSSEEEHESNSRNRLVPSCFEPTTEEKVSLPFPWVLHDLLKNTEMESKSHIVSWLPGKGDAFRVHNPHAFSALIAPKFFRQTKFKSFQRQCRFSWQWIVRWWYGFGHCRRTHLNHIFLFCSSVSESVGFQKTGRRTEQGRILPRAFCARWSIPVPSHEATENQEPSQEGGAYYLRVSCATRNPVLPEGPTGWTLVHTWQCTHVYD